MTELRPTRRENAIACIGYFIAFVGLGVILWDTATTMKHSRPVSESQRTPLKSWPTSTLSARASFTTFSIPTLRFPRSIPLM
jgi:hypothetical protein